ncbi:MAG TPA: hypothetical protein VM184_09080 [Gaiellaceae bacterium]|nr:hypothetical protein [Gaiellaceae bacterium]
MDIHPWTKYELAAARDEERQLRALAAYKALRGADGGAIGAVLETRSSRIRLLDRLIRREVGAVRSATPAV